MYTEVIETRGNWRVSIISDESPSEPDHDGQGAVIQCSQNRGYGSWETTLRSNDGFNHLLPLDGSGIVNPPNPTDEQIAASIENRKTLNGWFREADALSDAVAHALNHASERNLDEWTFVERYLRAFHGVVSFDRIDWDRDTLVCVITRDMQQRWGCDDEQIEGQAEAALKIWQAYGEGDAWLVDVEKRETWRKEGTDETRADWESVDGPVGGYYGRDDAESVAKDLLTEYIAASS